MEFIDPSSEAVLELQQMLNTPIEDQAASFELALLGVVLEHGMQALRDSESEDETCAALRQMLKSAFVIGRRHVNRLI
jgi:hypothetical protein